MLVIPTGYISKIAVDGTASATGPRNVPRVRKSYRAGAWSRMRSRRNGFRITGWRCIFRAWIAVALVGANPAPRRDRAPQLPGIRHWGDCGAPALSETPRERDAPRTGRPWHPRC